MKRTVLSLILLLATPSLTWAGACGMGTLADYGASGFSCTIDGKTFSNWGYTASASGGAVVIPASAIAVIPCPSASPSCSSIPTGEEGFVFTALWSVTSGQAQDSTIIYTVTSSSHIVDALLLYAGFGQTGTGFASVAETLSNGGFLFVSDPPGSPPSETLSFAPASSLTVVKDIEIVGGTSGTAAISAVANGWSQPSVPVDTYSIDYFPNVQTLGGLKKVVNDGSQGDTPGTGNLCDLIYVFNNEQLLECCGCIVTPNGSRNFDVKKNLVGNTVTGTHPNEVVVKEISSGPVGASSDAACDPTAPAPVAGLHSWAVKNQAFGTRVATTETASPYATLGAAELTDLAEDCIVLEELGTGQGICTCGTSD